MFSFTSWLLVWRPLISGLGASRWSQASHWVCLTPQPPSQPVNQSPPRSARSPSSLGFVRSPGFRPCSLRGTRSAGTPGRRRTGEDFSGSETSSALAGCLWRFQVPHSEVSPSVGFFFFLKLIKPLVTLRKRNFYYNAT